MKVLVLNPPSTSTKNYIRDLIYGCWCKGKRIGGATAPPLNLLYIATILQNNKHDVTFLDALAEQKNFEQVVEITKDFDIVIESTSQMSFTDDIKMLTLLKIANNKLITILFGSQPTFYPKEVLKHKEVDIIVKREAEFVIRDVINKMEKGEEWRDVAGIGFRVKNEIIINRESQFVDINELPIIDRTLLPKNIDYFNPIIKRIPYTTAMTSRGCPGRCTFCNVPNFYGNTNRFMSATKVIEEIKEIVRLGYKEIWFRDETFTAFPKRNKEICEWIINNKIDITWIANGRVDMITKEMMLLMKRAGCHMLKFGVESGIQRILDNVKKGTKIEQTRMVFKWAHEIGIDTHAHTMLGMPGDDLYTITKTIQFIKEIDPTTATFGICTPYVGTLLFDEVAKKTSKIKDGSALSEQNVHVEAYYNEYYTSLSDKELKYYIKQAYRSFYLRPSYIWKWIKKIKNLDELKRIILAGSNIFSFSLSKKNS